VKDYFMVDTLNVKWNKFTRWSMVSDCAKKISAGRGTSYPARRGLSISTTTAAKDGRCWCESLIHVPRMLQVSDLRGLYVRVNSA
jgi:hypothetical protein